MWRKYARIDLFRSSRYEVYDDSGGSSLTKLATHHPGPTTRADSLQPRVGQLRQADSDPRQSFRPWICDGGDSIHRQWGRVETLIYDELRIKSDVAEEGRNEGNIPQR